MLKVEGTAVARVVAVVVDMGTTAVSGVVVAVVASRLVE